VLVLLTKKNMKKFEINYECADSITLANLKQARDYHKSELKKLKKDPTYWIHADDQVMYQKLIKAMDYLIKNYYGN
jgi:biopolymer transport protein ExbD